MNIRSKALHSHHAPGLPCSHAVGHASLPHRGRWERGLPAQRGSFEPKHCAAAREHPGSPRARGPAAFLHGNSRRRGGSLGAWLAELPAAGCQELSLPRSISTSRHFRAGAAQPLGTLHCGQPWACRLDMLMLGDPESPGSLSHTHSTRASPATAAAAPGLCFGIYCSSPQWGCCRSCPCCSPRARCKEEMVAGLSGLCCSHPFLCLFVKGRSSNGVPLHREPLFAE